MLGRSKMQTNVIFLCLCILALFHHAKAAPPGRGLFRRRSQTRSVGEGRDRKFFKYLTRPDIDAPVWQVKVNESASLAPGHWFLAPYQELDQGEPGDEWVGPYIYDRNGELIWSGSPLFQHWNSFDFGVTTVDGEPMLSILYPHGRVGIILDSHYDVWKRVPLDEFMPDMHAFHVVDDGKRALVITLHNENATSEESAVVGFNGSCHAGYRGFVELDLENDNQPIFAWNSHEHIGLDESTYNTDLIEEECTHNWDIMHANAIDKFPDGHYLMSSRHTDALYKISPYDGSIVWRLGGTKSDFDFVGEGNPIFSRQHHAVVRGQNETHTSISVFDNTIGTGPSEHATNEQARGLLLSLDTIRMTASIESEFKNPEGASVSSRGSFQLLPNGNAFLCWTYSSHISEHLPDGSVVMEAELPVAAHTYRAFKYPWIGQPLQPPDVVSIAITTTVPDEVHTMVYVSWNGATEVATWILHKASKDGSVERETIALADRSGFETVITFEGIADFVVVEALSLKWESLGRSNVIRTIPLEEQGFDSQPSILEGESAPSEINIDPLLGSTVFTFFLGFLSCALSGGFLLWYSRQKYAFSWRTRWYGTRYERLSQDTD